MMRPRLLPVICAIGAASGGAFAADSAQDPRASVELGGSQG